RELPAGGVGTSKGNWDVDTGAVAGKPAWFGSLAWPPVDTASPASDDPTVIPAGYRYVHGQDP
ncbi:MAG: hypothetical protein KA190_07220, partial [Kofleriaceae bacterium]|nr:hypothetical protein [Kofleriaceae bacterium]